MSRQNVLFPEVKSTHLLSKGAENLWVRGDRDTQLERNESEKLCAARYSPINIETTIEKIDEEDSIEKIKSRDYVDLETFRKQGAIPKRNIKLHKNDKMMNLRSLENLAIEGQVKKKQLSRHCSLDTLLDVLTFGEASKTEKVRLNIPNEPFLCEFPPEPKYFAFPPSSIRIPTIRTYSHPSLDLDSEAHGKNPWNGSKRSKNVWSDGYFGSNLSKRSGPNLQDNLIKNDSDVCVDSSDELHICLPNSLVTELLEKCPYFDVNRIRSIFNQSQQFLLHSLTCIIEEVRETEVRTVISESFPGITEDEIKRMTSELMKSNEHVENYILAEKQRRKTRFISNYKTTEHVFDEDQVSFFYDAFNGDEDAVSSVLIAEAEAAVNDLKERKIVSLCNILPNVSSEFALKLVNDYEGDDTSLNNAIYDLLESGDYPKIQPLDWNTRQKEKLFQNYISNFSVTKFLEKVPDPKTVFYSPSVLSGRMKEEDAIKIINIFYPRFHLTTLTQQFRENNQCFYKTLVKLKRLYGDFSVNAKSELRKLDMDEATLQEVAFALYDFNIKAYLKEEKRRKNREKELAELENSFLYCNLCYDNKIIASDVVGCPEGHICCRNCVTKHVEILFSQGKLTFPCLEDCGAEYSLEALEICFTPSFIDKIVRKRASEEVEKANIPGLEKCPFCEYSYIPPSGDKIFRCLNEECMAESCRLCQAPNHIPLSCREIERPKDLTARKMVEEAMTEKLLRKCPKCEKKVVKDDGCNKINCVCGATWCYLCLELVRDYQHFNGMGGYETWKCSLFTNNFEVDEQVKKTGVAMKQALTEDDPDIVFINDPTELFSKEK